MSPEHVRIAELAKEDRARKFSSIAHLLTVEALHEAFKDLRKDASAGVDRVTYAEYTTAVQGNWHLPPEEFGWSSSPGESRSALGRTTN